MATQGYLQRRQGEKGRESEREGSYKNGLSDTLVYCGARLPVGKPESQARDPVRLTERASGAESAGRTLCNLSKHTETRTRTQTVSARAEVFVLKKKVKRKKRPDCFYQFPVARSLNSNPNGDLNNKSLEQDKRKGRFKEDRGKKVFKECPLTTPDKSLRPQYPTSPIHSTGY